MPLSSKKVKNINLNGNSGGGDKKQGLAPKATHFFKAPFTGRQYSTDTGDGKNRFSLVCVNQLGGIGRGRSQFNVHADGKKCYKPIPKSELDPEPQPQPEYLEFFYHYDDKLYTYDTVTDSTISSKNSNLEQAGYNHNNELIIIGSNYIAYTSSDLGTTWTETSQDNNDVNLQYYRWSNSLGIRARPGNGITICCSRKHKPCMFYSTDGYNFKNFIQPEITSQNIIYDAAYNGSRWIAGGNVILTSINGTDGTWTSTGKSVGWVTRIVWDGNKWLIAGSNNGLYTLSKDLTTLTHVWPSDGRTPIGGNTRLMCLYYNSNIPTYKYWAGTFHPNSNFGNTVINNEAVLKSIDGETWENVKWFSDNYNNINRVSGIVYCNNYYYVGLRLDNSTFPLLKSTDGENWTEVSPSVPMSNLFDKSLTSDMYFP